MAHSTRNKPPNGTSSVRLSSKYSDCPVVKAAFTSCIGVDVHHSVLVCAFQQCDLSSSEIHTEIREFGTGASQLEEFASWCKQLLTRHINS